VENGSLTASVLSFPLLLCSQSCRLPLDNYIFRDCGRFCYYTDQIRALSRAIRDDTQYLQTSLESVAADLKLLHVQQDGVLE
jgi:hypothetical protein